MSPQSLQWIKPSYILPFFKLQKSLFMLKLYFFSQSLAILGWKIPINNYLCIKFNSDGFKLSWITQNNGNIFRIWKLLTEKYLQKVIIKKIAITFRTFKVVEWSILYCSNECYSQRLAMAYRISILLIDIHNCLHKFTVKV